MERDFLRAFESLLQGVQGKREVRADVDIADVLDLVFARDSQFVGCVVDGCPRARLSFR
ncbi:hypothetical protein GCM10029964_040970 [Kibdelosporangium lantanae]